MNTLPNLIDKYMKEHNYSYRELAEEFTKIGIDVSHSTVRNWCNGRGMKDDNLYKLSDFFNVTFTIVPHEKEIKYFDSTSDISEVIQPGRYDEADLEFINDPTSQPYILLAKWIKKKGFESEEVRDLAKMLGLIK